MKTFVYVDLCEAFTITMILITMSWPDFSEIKLRCRCKLIGKNKNNDNGLSIYLTRVTNINGNSNSLE